MPKPQGKDVANSTTNICSLQKAINIQLLYGINQATNQDSWSSSFYSVLLYGLLGHLPLDSKNIKEFLHYITNYIKHKSIDHTKSNNILNLNGIGEVVWNFIFAIYKSEWDAFVTNKDNRTFR